MNSLERARSQVREAGGEELCERLEHLDAMRAILPKPSESVFEPDPEATHDYDVVLVGGGLSLLLAPMIAARGLSVAVFDRARIGMAHREWNGSAAEVEALANSGVVSSTEIAELIVARYDHGICRWHEGGAYPVRGVLDMAIDAGGLLSLARKRCEERGVHLFDGHTLLHMVGGTNGVGLRFRVSGDDRPKDVVARVAIDGRGASSDNATADLICPTVGGVLRGLREGEDERSVNPRVGDILATTEHVEEGRQHIWEAFPGRKGETTVYLFYYALADRVGPGSLLGLYGRFFERLSTYKDGDPTLIRPTFGYIPGWSRLTPAPRPIQGTRVILVGDAAARHSPLTFCGFGNTVRSLDRTVHRIVSYVEGEPQRTLEDAPIHAGTGALARMMATPPTDPNRAHELNRLLDTAFEVLYEMGEEAYGALLRDEMKLGDFVRFLHRTSVKRPQVYRDVFTSFGIVKVGRWGANVVRELVSG